MRAYAHNASMEKVVAIALLTIGGLAAAGVFIGNVLPAVASSTAAQERATAQFESVSERDVRLTQLLSELDEGGSWQDLDNDGYFDVWGWAKNMGTATIRDLDDADVFIGRLGTYQRVPHEADAGAAYPRWTAAVEGGGAWLADKTLKITVHYASTLPSADYAMRLVIPTGAGTTKIAGF